MTCFRTASFFVLAAFAGFSATAQESEFDLDPTAEAGGAAAKSQSLFLSDAIQSQPLLGFDFGRELASQDADVGSQLTYWTGVEGKAMSGDTEGWQAEGVFGMDYFVSSETLIGGFVGLGSSESQTMGIDTDINARILGGYYARALNDGSLLHVFLGGGQAGYQTDGANIDVPRQMAGFSISGERPGDKTVLIPSLSAVAVRERIPEFFGNNGFHAATTVEGVTLSAEARWEYNEPMGEGDLLPYLSVGLDYLVTDYNDGNKDEALAPRFGAGVFGIVGDGLLAIDVDAGKVNNGTIDIGASATYSFGF